MCVYTSQSTHPVCRRPETTLVLQHHNRHNLVLDRFACMRIASQPCICPLHITHRPFVYLPIHIYDHMSSCDELHIEQRCHPWPWRPWWPWWASW